MRNSAQQREVHHVSTQTDYGFLRIKDIAGLIVPVGKATLWRWIKQGKFPKPMKLNGTVTVWCAADVKAWCDT
jgi:predicted DNA-binding transcriptional regulator AlpA